MNQTAYCEKKGYKCDCLEKKNTKDSQNIKPINIQSIFNKKILMFIGLILLVLLVIFLFKNAILPLLIYLGFKNYLHLVRIKINKKLSNFTKKK